MITNFKELSSNFSSIMNALNDLNILDNDNQLQSQQQISIRLKSFFENAQSITQFLKSLFKIFEKETQDEGNIQKKLKLLLFLHIILSSSVARAELSKILISKQINIQINNTTLGKVCQQYYFYLYKLASQTTFINEDVINGDILIYFTLSNQCNLGISLQSLIENVESFQTNQLIGNIVKFIYFDLQDIAIFIIKDVKSLIENQNDTKQNKLHILELQLRQFVNISFTFLQFYYIQKTFYFTNKHIRNQKFNPFTYIQRMLGTLIKDAGVLSIQSLFFALFSNHATFFINSRVTLLEGLIKQQTKNSFFKTFVQNK